MRLNFFSKITSYEITKRQKFIFMSGILTLLLIATQTVGEGMRYQIMGFLALATIVLAIFSLWGELSGIKYFLLLLLPVYFVIGATLFYFLLPVRWLTRVPFALVFGISVYLLMLTSNIYNVGAIRTIALLRAAHAVGLLFSLVSTFFLANVLFSLHLPFYLVIIGIFMIIEPLYLVALWSYELDDFISKKVFNYTIIFSLVTIEVSGILAFMPIAPINGALTVATVMYVLLGIVQFEFAERLKKRVVWEHLVIALLVFIVVLVTTHWTG